MQSHLGVNEHVGAAITARQLAPTIVVSPQWAGTLDTECVNGTPSEQVETWPAQDLPAWLHAHYAVRSAAQNWATYGYSAGAWCSRMLTMRHPDLFGADIDLSGYSKPWFEQPYVPFAATSAEAASYDLVAMARTAPPPVAIYLTSSPGDAISYASTVQFEQAARAPMRVTWVPAPGGHSVALWEPQTTLGLAWLGRTLAGFRP